jgi:hypothetical protein
MFLVKFSNGAGLSVEFSPDALADAQAERGAWLELRSDHADAVQRKVQAFGLKANRASEHAVFLRASAGRAGVQDRASRRRVSRRDGAVRRRLMARVITRPEEAVPVFRRPNGHKPTVTTIVTMLFRALAFC